MGKLLNSLKEYFNNTPREELEKDLKELEYLNEIGPDVEEYIKYIEELHKNEKQIHSGRS